MKVRPDFFGLTFISTILTSSKKYRKTHNKSKTDYVFKL